ncbi:coiled-coil domain-containing protein 63-like isoform X2 [Rhopalosiphum maidis]|uniref:coiled-coil domain-containing protein 63-like isoform X2 n=1 Tax=Rhopalosiphum maidis TaxID=43146 RepID=UPI000EFDF1AF|nr:coiled-coil domain-containing protein 63-like isoform X2 [Rhopalosiphum maidis]
MDNNINGDGEDNGNDLLAEELAKLQRQYMLMESNKKAYTEEMGSYLAKQKKIISSLEQEKVNLVEHVSMDKNKRKEINDLRLKECLVEKWNEYLSVKDELTDQKKCHDDIEKEILKIQNELDLIFRQRESSAGKLKNKVEYDLQRHEELLENKLHVKTVKFNKVLTENARLRNEINNLLVQRSQFNEAYKALTARLDDSKQIMMDLIEQATTAYEQREDAQNRLINMSDEDKQQIALHKAEVKELQRQYDRDLKLQDFLSIKGQHRVLMDFERKEEEKKQNELGNRKEQAEKWVDLMGWLQMYVGESNIDRIVDLFVRQEEENFALFTYINELNSEVDDLQKEVVVLRNRVQEQRAINESRASKQEENMNGLRAHLQQLVDDANQENDRIKTVHTELTELLESVEKLFLSINCNLSPMYKILGDDIRANVYNMTFYVDLIETKVSDVVKNLKNMESM